MCRQQMVHRPQPPGIPATGGTPVLDKMLVVGVQARLPALVPIGATQALVRLVVGALKQRLLPIIHGEEVRQQRVPMHGGMPHRVGAALITMVPVPAGAAPHSNKVDGTCNLWTVSHTRIYLRMHILRRHPHCCIICSLGTVITFTSQTLHLSKSVFQVILVCCVERY